MIKTIIVEDEKPAARRLGRLLLRNGLDNIATLHSVTDAIYWLKTHENPDLIFLDIQLSDGLSFEIFEEVTVNSAIIFTTAYDQYALKAFKLNSIDYLLKPIDVDELETAIKKYKALQISKRDIVANIEVIKNLFGKSKDLYKERFTTQVGQHLKIIEAKNIECLYSEDKATFAFMNSQKVRLLDGSLESIYKQLDPKNFFRVNRKFVVNIKAIKDMISYTNSRLQIKLTHYNQEAIIVSREKVTSFKNWLS